MSLKKLRLLAFHTQQGRCFYCGAPMWLKSAHELGMRPRPSRFLQCTAEHLVARQDGGQDTPENIVAACWLCNLRRHQRRHPAPTPEAYKAMVQRRVGMGKWWPTLLLKEERHGN